MLPPELPYDADLDEVQADRYASVLLRWAVYDPARREFVVPRPYVPALALALGRRGWTFAPGERTGWLRVSPLTELPDSSAPPSTFGPPRPSAPPRIPPPPVSSCEPIDERAHALGVALRREVVSRRMTDRAAAEAMGCDVREVSLLRWRRYEEIGRPRLVEIGRRYGMSQSDGS